MRALSCFMLLVLVAVVMAVHGPHYNLNDAPALFEKYIKDYDKHYKDEADKELHYQAFVKSLENINKRNAAQSGAVFDINKFADYTEEEMAKMRGLRTIIKEGDKN